MHILHYTSCPSTLILTINVTPLCPPPYIQILDDGCFWNHSDTPNTGAGTGELETSSAALRDIKVGALCCVCNVWCVSHASCVQHGMLMRTLPGSPYISHQAGEELLDDYGTYEYPKWLMDLFDAWKVPQDYFAIKTCVE